MLGAKIKKRAFQRSGHVEGKGMAADEPYSLRLNRVFGPSLPAKKKWYAVSSDWSYRPSEFVIGPLFTDDVLDVNIYDLFDRNGGQVNPSWFGSSRKKDRVLVSTLFGIFAKAVRSKNPTADKFIGSVEFAALKQQMNDLELDNLAGLHEQLPANSSIFPETPPSLPEDLRPPQSVHHKGELMEYLGDLADIEKGNLGPRLKAKRVGVLAKNVIDVLASNSPNFSGCDLGKIFGYGFLLCPEDRQRFVTDLMSSAVHTVAEKQGVRKALSRMLSEDLNRKYLEAQRVPDWVQLYVKLSTKLPNKSWQTLLNFLNIGRSGVSLCLLFV